VALYSLSRKTLNTRENFWNIYCFVTSQKRDETAKDNHQTAACHDLIRNNKLAFSSNELAFLPGLTLKNQTTEFRINLEVRFSFLATKKTRIKNHQLQPTSMPLATAREAHRSAPLLIGLFFFLSDALSVYSIQHRFP